MRQTTTGTPQRRRWVPTLYAIGSLGLLVLYSSANRPIWFDEMVTFTIGGLPNVGAVVDQILQTATNLNQGTTGVYLLAEYLSLSLFGAHWWSMRLPSLLTAVWTLVSLYVFLRTKSIHPLLIVATPLLAMGYPTLWYFAGEARTYMPLVAGVLGVLAYYSLADTQRQTPAGRTLGWGSVLIGVLFHPYFLLYWPIIVAFTGWEGAWRRQQRPTMRQVWHHSNPLLVVVGTSVGFTLALATWMRGNIEQPVPWDQWLGSPLPKEILTALLWPFFDSGWLGVMAAVIVVVLVITSRPTTRASSFIPALVLMAVAAVLTLIISAASILAEFWVFPRQWIGSQVLVLASLPWLASTLVVSKQSGWRVRWAALAVAALLLLPSAVSTGLWKASQIYRWSTVQSLPQLAELSEMDLMRLLDEGNFPSNRIWMEFSQANLMQGGDVWPTLGRYYSDKDWSSVTLEQGPRQELFLE